MRKIRRMAILPIAAAVLLVAACGSTAGGRVDSGEIVVPEMSSEDLLVSSLEYLLQEDGENGNDTEDDPETEAPQEADSIEERQTEDVNEEQDAEVSGNEAVIYFGNAGSYDLSRETVYLEEKTAEELVGALAKHNIVSLDTKVLGFDENNDAGEQVLRLDLSKAAGEYLKTMSKEAECIILASIVNTFLENYDADSIYLMVNGEVLTTKSAAYTDALKKCTPEELLDLLAADEEEDAQKEEQQQEEKKAVSEDSMN